VNPGPWKEAPVLRSLSHVVVLRRDEVLLVVLALLVAVGGPFVLLLHVLLLVIHSKPILKVFHYPQKIFESKQLLHGLVGILVDVHTAVVVLLSKVDRLLGVSAQTLHDGLKVLDANAPGFLSVEHIEDAFEVVDLFFGVLAENVELLRINVF